MSEQETSNPSPAATSPVGLGKWWWLSAALVAAVAIGLGIVLIWPGDRSDPQATPSPASSPALTATTAPSPGTAEPPTQAAPPAGWEDAGCNDTNGTDKIPTSAPTGVKWVPLGSMAVPTHEEYGPRDIAELPLRRCYQHSPTGALFALINILAAGGAGGSGPDSATVLEEQMTPGRTRDQALAETMEPQAWNVAGFRVNACDAGRCNVDLVVSLSGRLVQWTVSAVWDDGDWKLDGNQALSAAVASALPPGFSPWAPGM